MAKIKLTFNEEHIALIKALNFEKIDFDAIVKSFATYDKHVFMVKDIDGLECALKSNKKADLSSFVEELTVGDVLEDYHIDIDSVFGVDTFNPWGGTFLWEQMAWILGIHDHAYPDTLEDPTGAKFPEEDMEHMKDLCVFIVGNLQNIENILHQFCTEGIQPNATYWCYDHQNIWHKE